MFISIPHNLAFIHVPKTGGTSIRTALIAFHEKHYIKDKEWFSKIKDGWGTHSSYKQIKSQHKYIDQLASFCIIRNPWERMVSMYLHFLRMYPKFIKWENRFNDWIDYVYQNYKNPLMYPNILPRLTQCEIIGQTKYIIRYENFDEQVNSLFDSYGINIVIPRLNVNPDYNYQLFYNNKSYNIIKCLFKEDIERFFYA